MPMMFRRRSGKNECIPNVMGQIFQTDQGFLAGYPAAGMSKTGKIAFFGGANIPTVAIFAVGIVGHGSL